MTTTDTAPSPDHNPTLTPATLRALARELRRLASKVERDICRDEHVSALSALTAIKPLTGALADAALSKVMTAAEEAAEPVNSPSHNNPLGYL